ncbi:MAG: hypothetical protein ACU85E_16695 [Gammaproteobacteria bacterium]
MASNRSVIQGRRNGVLKWCMCLLCVPAWPYSIAAGAKCGVDEQMLKQIADRIFCGRPMLYVPCNAGSAEINQHFLNDEAGKLAAGVKPFARESKIAG